MIEKNGYGQYSLKMKAPIEGHVWVGKSLVPRLMFYSFFFIGAFAAETGIVLLSLVIESLVVEAGFFFAMAITLVAVLLFILEGVQLYRKLNPKQIRTKDL